MTRPLTEPTALRKVAGAQWDVHQLQRRPVQPGAGTIIPGVWYDAVLLGSWTDVAGRGHVQYRLLVDAGGLDWPVEFRGSTTGGNVGDNVFQLPSALWPDVDRPMGGRAAADLSQGSSFDVLTTGYVVLAAVFG